MAYETASDVTLDNNKKELANEELVTTGNLADEVGQSKATAVINETKIQVIENNITDINEITNIVNNVSNNYDVTISEDQSEEIASLRQKLRKKLRKQKQLRKNRHRRQKNLRIMEISPLKKHRNRRKIFWIIQTFPHWIQMVPMRQNLPQLRLYWNRQKQKQRVITEQVFRKLQEMVQLQQKLRVKIQKM